MRRVRVAREGRPPLPSMSNVQLRTIEHIYFWSKKCASLVGRVCVCSVEKTARRIAQHTTYEAVGVCSYIHMTVFYRAWSAKKGRVCGRNQVGTEISPGSLHTSTPPYPSNCLRQFHFSGTTYSSHAPPRPNTHEAHHCSRWCGSALRQHGCLCPCCACRRKLRVPEPGLRLFRVGCAGARRRCDDELGWWRLQEGGRP